MLRKWRGDVVCLQETKIENVSKELVRSVGWGGGGGDHMWIGHHWVLWEVLVGYL